MRKNKCGKICFKVLWKNFRGKILKVKVFEALIKI
jgi:hypothetical protein